MIQHHITHTSDATLTIVGGGATVVLWGLHVSDICMILSTLATLCALAMQIYVATRRISRLERRQDAHMQVTKAVSEAVRVVDKNQKDSQS